MPDDADEQQEGDNSPERSRGPTRRTWLAGAAALVGAPSAAAAGTFALTRPSNAVRYFPSVERALAETPDGARFILAPAAGGSALFENAAGEARLLADFTGDAQGGAIGAGRAQGPADRYLEQLGGIPPAGDAGHDINEPAGALILGQRIWNRPKPAISYGRNDLAASREWPPLRAIGNDIRHIGAPDASGSKYGIISYAPNSIISGNYVQNGRNANRKGDDVDGIYVKARGTIVSDNVVIDFCQTEGAFNIKGDKRGGSRAPAGSEVCLSNNLAAFTDAYNRAVLAAGGTTHGIKYLNDGIRSQGFTCINAAGNSVHTTGSSIDDLQLSDHYSYQAGRNAFGFYASGRGHVVRNVYARESGENYVLFSGQSEPADYLVAGGRCEGAGRGFHLNAAAAEMLSVHLRGHYLRDVKGEIILLGGAGCRSLVVEGVTAEHGNRRFISVEAPVSNIRWIDSGPIDFTTGSDAPAEFLQLPVPQGGCVHLHCSFLGDDGRDHFARGFVAIMTARAGQGSAPTLQEIHRSQSDGAAGWDATAAFDARRGIVSIGLRGGTAQRRVRWTCLEIRYQSV